jgi:hypothetical protein
MFRDDLKAALTRAEQLQSDLARAEGRAESSEEEVKGLRAQLASQQRDLERLRKKVQEQERRPATPPQKKRGGPLVMMLLVVFALTIGGGIAGFLLMRAKAPTPAAPVTYPAPVATPPKAPAPRPTTPPEPSPPPLRDDGTQLNRRQIVRGMGTISKRVRDCYDRFRVPGLAMARVKIEPSGRVSRAEVTGLFAGTPTGICITAAVKAARFPASKHETTITYPFALR